MLCNSLGYLAFLHYGGEFLSYNLAEIQATSQFQVFFCLEMSVYH